MKRIAIASLIMALAGCATTPVPTGTAKDVPVERVFNQDIFKPKANYARVTIKRDGGLMGAMCDTKISIDKVPVAILGTEEKIEVYLPIGEHMLSANVSDMCGGDIVELKAIVTHVENLIFRTGYGSNKGLVLQPTTY